MNPNIKINKEEISITDIKPQIPVTTPQEMVKYLRTDDLSSSGNFLKTSWTILNP